MAKPKYPFPLVEVKWLDAQTSHGWEDKDEIDSEVPVVTTIGFLLKETEDSVVIASTIGQDKTHNSRILIPIGMIKEKRILR